ncbi:DoxX family protein [Sphingomonas sp. Leaf38]|uniref:DoxX family protein n=1 Tax=Sphingomonas sp. Leaf38 TaxID=1736217 RepID=UPI0007015B0B|nr:DoxX family protein [Sphingomonas sp. Leaf38]KQN31076.1 DoxX family protein [Sphingomonas sp. Leaf38]
MPIPATWSARLLSVMRIVVALVFFSHGVSKLFGLPPFPYPMTPLLYVAGVLEVVGGGLLIVGLFTRPVAFVLSGMSAIAYFLDHAPQGPFPIANDGEAAVLYCFVFLYLAAAGGGAWSVDAGRGQR